jgi:hypothetical protein
MSKKFYVSVTVEVNFEVDAETAAEAEAEGWNYENYMAHAEVFSVDVEDITSEFDEDEEEGE